MARLDHVARSKTPPSSRDRTTCRALKKSGQNKWAMYELWYVGIGSLPRQWELLSPDHARISFTYVLYCSCFRCCLVCVACLLSLLLAFGHPLSFQSMYVLRSMDTPYAVCWPSLAFHSFFFGLCHLVPLFSSLALLGWNRLPGIISITQEYWV